MRICLYANLIEISLSLTHPGSQMFQDAQPALSGITEDKQSHCRIYLRHLLSFHLEEQQGWTKLQISWNPETEILSDIFRLILLSDQFKLCDSGAVLVAQTQTIWITADEFLSSRDGFCVSEARWRGGLQEDSTHEDGTLGLWMRFHIDGNRWLTIGFRSFNVIEQCDLNPCWLMISWGIILLWYILGLLIIQ